MEAIKPCPFCGGPAGAEKVSDPWKPESWLVGCNTCNGDDGSVYFDGDSRDEAIAAWNTRPSPVRDEGAGTMEVTRAAEDAACAAYRALDMGQRWTLEPAMRAALKAALPHLAAPVSAPGMDREAVARIIRGWDLPPENARIGPGTRRAIDEANAKADQIIALQRGSEPADGSQVEPSTTGAGRHIPLEPPPFIQWNGGENPAPGKVVDYELRGGRRGRAPSENLGWVHAPINDYAYDIIAYRIIPANPSDTGKREPPGLVNCTHVLRRDGNAYPRTCARCGLGPCPFYNKDGTVKP